MNSSKRFFLKISRISTVLLENSINFFSCIHRVFLLKMVSSSSERVRKFREKLKKDSESYKKYQEKEKNYYKSYVERIKIDPVKLELRQRRHKDSVSQIRKKKNHPILNPSGDEKAGYYSRGGLVKKVNKIDSILPKNPVKISQVLNELNKRHAIPEQSKVKPITSKEEIALAYMHKDRISTCLPGKNDKKCIWNEDGEKLVMQKRVLQESMKEIHVKFKIEHPDGVELSKFKELRPGIANF